MQLVHSIICNLLCVKQGRDTGVNPAAATCDNLIEQGTEKHDEVFLSREHHDQIELHARHMLQKCAALESASIMQNSGKCSYICAAE